MKCPKCEGEMRQDGTFAMDPIYQCDNCGYRETLTPFSPLSGWPSDFVPPASSQGSVTAYTRLRSKTKCPKCGHEF